MKLLNSLSLKSKLILPIVLFTGIIFFATQGTAFVSAFETQKENLINRVTVLAKGVAYNLQAAILFNDSYSATEVLDAFSADEEVVRVKLYTANGQLFAMYEREGTAAPVPTEREREEIKNNTFAVADEYIYLLVPVEMEGEVIAKLRVIISKQSFQTLYHTALSSSFIFFVLLVVAALVLYMTVDKFIVGPVYNLNMGVHAFINRKRRDITTENAANDEIGDLVRAFNTMLDRLGQREQQVAYTLDKLEEEKSFANEVVETVKHALIVVDNTGEIVHFNGATCDVFRCTSAFIKGANLDDLIETDDVNFVHQAIHQGQEFTDRQVWIRDVFKQYQLLQVSSTKLSKRGQILFAIQDITEVEAAQSRQRLAAGVFENSQDGLMVTNQDDVITMVNPSVSRLLGYSQEALLGKTPEETFEWQQFRSLMPTIKDSVHQFGQWQGEIWEKHLFGHMVPMFVKVSKINVKDDEERCDFVYILSDLSSVKEMERLEYLAHHDSLTGLANRAHLYRVLDECLKDEREVKNGLALLYLDLDGFKLVNDTYGHDAGDEVLKQVSERLLSQVRSQDLVARLSGDEFVVLLTSTDKASISILADRLIGLIQQDIVYRGRILNVGASIGVHYIEQRNVSMDQLLRAADTAMYKAKSLGKGQFVLSENK
ncbi:sensor domain-containing diguanylate cyclase [Vibrio sinaloensis]|uniref:sensor domain-containing diguanylate cyclase n=1 Tax=Photobacterium sp. (strain ATCC 43367) TaxID=379097 RepID=UPI0035E54C73